MLKKVVSLALITMLSSVAQAGNFGNFKVNVSGALAGMNWVDATYFATSPAGSYTSSFSAELIYTTDNNFFFSNELAVAYYRDITVYNDALTIGYYFNPVKYVYISPFVGVGVNAMDTLAQTATGKNIRNAVVNPEPPYNVMGSGSVSYTLPIGVTLTVPVHEKVYLSAQFSHSVKELSKSNISNYVNYGVAITYKFDAGKLVDSITLKGAYFNKDSSALALYAGGYAAQITVSF